MTKGESSLARKATAAAISSASANRPSGMWTRRRAARSGSLANSSRSSGVLTGPGQSALTRMPSAGELAAPFPGLAEHAAVGGSVEI
ncbi:hypothetical protein STENM223S_04065 [Streptomyces tendae]